jgi:hypothetical protein
VIPSARRIRGALFFSLIRHARRDASPFFDSPRQRRSPITVAGPVRSSSISGALPKLADPLQ